MFLYRSLVTATVTGEVSLFYVVYVPLALLVNQPTPSTTMRFQNDYHC